MVTIDEVRAFASTLPRSSEAIVRGRVKFRIGRIVYLAFSRDGTEMGFAFPKEWRDALIEAEPEKFSLPGEADLRYHWVHVRLAMLGRDEMQELARGCLGIRGVAARGRRVSRVALSVGMAKPLCVRRSPGGRR